MIGFREQSTRYLVMTCVHGCVRRLRCLWVCTSVCVCVCVCVCDGVDECQDMLLCMEE